MVVNVGGNLNLAAQTSYALLQSNGTQTINFTGSGGVHQMNVLGGNNSSYSGASAGVESTGLQTISYDATGGGTLGIVVTGGSGVNNNQTAYVYNNADVQQYLNGVALYSCQSCATWNWAHIQSNGGQAISASTITINGGVGTSNAVAGNGNYANIQNKSTSVSQNITATGAISITGGTAPGNYNVTYPNDGVGNEAEIHSDGAQTIKAGSIALSGGGDSKTFGGAFLTGKLGQNITTIGDFSMTGGLSNAAGQYGIGAPAIIGEQNGENITLNIGGKMTMTGGAGSTSPALIGSAQGTPVISITAANISMNSGTGASSQIGVLTGVPAGSLSMTSTSGIAQDASSEINTASLVTSSTAGTILKGANAVSSFGASNSTSGDIALTNTANPLTLTGINNTGGGNVSVNNSGAISIAGTIATTGTVSVNSNGGSISSALAAGQTDISADTLQLVASTGLGTASAPLKLVTSNLNATTLAGVGNLSDTPTTAVTLVNFTTGDNSAVTYTQNGLDLKLTGTMSSLGGSVSIDPPVNFSMSNTAQVSSGGGAIAVQASGNVILATINAGSGAINLNAGGDVTAVSGGGPNLIGSAATVNIGGKAAFNTQVQKLDATVAGNFTITDTSGNVFSDVLLAPTVVQQLITTATATTITNSSSNSLSSTSNASSNVLGSLLNTNALTSGVGSNSSLNLLNTSGATIGGTIGSFGGNESTTLSTTSTGIGQSGNTGTSNAGSSGGSDQLGNSQSGSGQTDSGSASGNGSESSSGGSGSKDKDKEKSGAGTSKGGNDKDNSKGKSNAKPNKC